MFGIHPPTLRRCLLPPTSLSPPPQVGLRAWRGMGWVQTTRGRPCLPLLPRDAVRGRLTDSLPRHGGGRFPAARPVRVWFCSPRARRPAAGALAVSARTPARGEPCQCSHRGYRALHGCDVCRHPSSLPPRSGRTRETHTWHVPVFRDARALGVWEVGTETGVRCRQRH
jgi:hypothetical protein